jgi:hypothetical protein
MKPLKNRGATRLLAFLAGKNCWKNLEGEGRENKVEDCSIFTAKIYGRKSIMVNRRRKMICVLFVCCGEAN